MTELFGFIPSGSILDLSEVSSNLKTVKWNGDGTIDVTFQKGAVYRYFGAPESLWDFLVKGKEITEKSDLFSIGKAFHQEVISKPDIYKYERIRQ